MSDSIPPVNEQKSPKTQFPGAAYLSALLIALALASLVFMASRRQDETQQPVLAAPTVIPTQGPATIYIVGEVMRPGVYTLPAGSRIEDAIERAGGMTAKADPLGVNLAQRLHDEMQINVPAKPESKPPGIHPAPSAQATHAKDEQPEVVNINTATQEQLETLPGIGPTKAKAIIEYRETKGPFRNPIDIQKVRGIGPKTWEQFKDRIRV